MNAVEPVFDEPLHTTGEHLYVRSFAMRQALAWWVAAELTRRHPTQLRVVEAHVHQYGMAVTVVSRGTSGLDGWTVAAFLTLGESFHITPDHSDWSRGRFNWLDVLLAADRRGYVVNQLESVLALSPPRATPPTAASSVGVRLISTYLDRTALGPTRWVFLNGATVDDDSGSPAERLFEALPEVHADRAHHTADDAVWHMVETRYWFLCPVNAADEAGPPVAAVDTAAGIAWNEHGRIELLPAYHRVGNKIDALASQVFPPTH